MTEAGMDIASKPTATEKHSYAPENKPRPVDSSKFVPAVIAKWLAHYGLKAGGSTHEQAVRLETYLVDNIGEESVAECHTCGADGDYNEPECPFCGDGEVIGNDPPAPSKPPPPPAVIAKPRTSASVPPPAPLKAAGPTSPTAKPPPLRSAATDTLDAAIEQYWKSKTASAVSYWQLGRAILPIYTEKMWTARKGEGGAPLYKTWGQFCTNELHVSSTHAFQLMDVARTFSKEDFERIGVTKLSLILKLPADVQAEMKAKAATMPRAELLNEVREKSTGKQNGTGRREGGRAIGTKNKKPTKAALAAEKRLPPGKITVGVVADRAKAVAMTRAGKPAKFRGEEGRVTFPLANGTEETIVVTSNIKGQMVIRREINRIP